MNYKIGKIKNPRTTLASAGDQVIPPVIITGGTLDTIIYNDVTSISSWDEYADITNLGIVRDGIKSIYNDLGWASLSEEEKKIASKFFVSSKSERDSVLTEDEQKGFAERMGERNNVEKESTKYGGLIYDKEPVDIGDILEDSNFYLPNYTEYFYEFSSPINNAWNTVTLSGSGVSPNSIVFISVDQTGNQEKSGGFREVGSTNDRKKSIAKKSGFAMPVKLNSNSQIEVYAEASTITFYLTSKLG